MSGILRRSSLNRRIRRIRRQITSVRGDIEALSRTVARAETTIERTRIKTEETVPPESLRISEGELPLEFAERQPSASGRKADRAAAPAAQPRRRKRTAKRRSAPATQPTSARRRLRNDRLVDYLSTGSVGEYRPLRHERHIQRNKAIVVSSIAVVALLYVLYVVFGMR
jgi:hypothetical protein